VGCGAVAVDFQGPLEGSLGVVYSFLAEIDVSYAEV
jgi:hypothetical protein